MLSRGSLGVGKNTGLRKMAGMLMTKGFTVSGMLSGEIRSNGTSVGFEVMDLYTGKTGWPAHTNQKHGSRLDKKYLVNLDNLDGVWTEAAEKANKECDVVAVDEVDSMELFLEKFRHAARDVVDDPKTVVATVRWRTEDQLVKKIETRQDAEMFVVTWENRGSLPPAIASKAEEYLAATRLE